MVNAFFKQMGKAIFRPQDYYILGKVKFENSALYVLVLSVIYAIIGIAYISSFLHIGRLADWLKFYAPDYQYDGRQLHSEEQYFNVIDDFGIYFDTTIYQMSDEEMEMYADEYSFQKGVFFTASNIYVYVENNKPAKLSLFDLTSEPFDKEWVVDKLDMVIGFAGAIIALLICIAVFLIYYLIALVYFVIGVFITIILKKQCNYGELFNVCLYAKTLMFVVEMICLWIPAVNTGGVVFMICSAAVSMIYVVIGIFRMHKYFPKQIRYAR